MIAAAGSTAIPLVGQPLPPANNLRFVQGQGYYVDDHVLAGAAHMAVVRSPHACANVRIVSIDGALRSAGVIAVLTGDDARADGLGQMRSVIERKRPDGRRHYEPDYPLLAQDKVRHVGFPVAIVLAETLAAAHAAAEAIEIDYEVLPSVTETADLLKPGAPAVWEEAPDNICFVHTAGDEAAVEAAFASAAHVVTIDTDISRVAVNPMEMRNAIADHDRRTGRSTLWTGAQIAHDLRADLCRILGISERELRVVAPDIGGGFGLKLHVHQEQALVLWAARRIGRPVRWQATRNESFQSDSHARDLQSKVSLALDAEGQFLALRVDSVCNLGAHLNSFTIHPSTANLGGLSGTYRTPHVFAKVTGLFSNKVPNGPYRGAGRPEATFQIERVIDAAARKLGMDRAELRRKNLIPPASMPWKTGFIFTYDSGQFEANLNTALSISDWKGFPKRRKAAERRGKLRGIGIVNAIEIAGGPQGAPAEEFLELRFDRSGELTLLSGLHSHGHGLETTLAQLVHDRLGFPIEKMRVRFGDTDEVYHGKGSGGSRSAAAASASASAASERIIAKARKLAAHILEADEPDLMFADGAFRIGGTDRSIALGDVAKVSFDRTRVPKGMDIGLSANALVMPGDATFPNGCHVCEVEIDPETGVVTVVGYWAVEDVGRVLNPLVVDGQVHGGVAQGIGQALMEQVLFDPDSGQLLTASFMDYAMPRAADLPMFETRFNEVLAASNPFGAKGVGEAGTVAAIPVVINAVNDALDSAGKPEMEMPATPARVWAALHRG